MTATGYLHRTDQVSCRGSRTTPAMLCGEPARRRRAAVLVVTLTAPAQMIGERTVANGSVTDVTAIVDRAFADRAGETPPANG